MALHELRGLQGCEPGTDRAAGGREPTARGWRKTMLDVILLVVVGAFFGVAVLYVHGCDRM
jgi:hypothetical protein